jgi:outer membrane protein TolC
MKRLLKRTGSLMAALALAGCASYRAQPLATRPNLAPNLASLDLTVPSLQPNATPRRIDPYQPLSINQIGLLAILNDPDLASERGQLGVASAALLSESLLPNPQLSFGFSALLGGPGASSPSYAASLTQDVMALITYRPRVAAVRAQLHSVNAQLLWQEWQAAQKARLLALDIYGDDQQIHYRQRELSLLSNELGQVRRATQQGNLDLTAEAPLIASTAVAEGSLASVKLLQLKAWQNLDALLGLESWVRFPISRPEIAPPPADISQLLASLPERRPDLIGLQFGYHSSEEQLRVAILNQFPAFSVGPNYTYDTSKVQSLGPAVNIGVPIFNRNQGGIATAKATRAVLYAQYQAELDSSQGTAWSLVAQIKTLEADLDRAQHAAATAANLSGIARRAYQSSSIDQRSLADYETTVLERQLEVIDFRNQIDADELALEVELGLGLPQTRIAPQARIQARIAPTHQGIRS